MLEIASVDTTYIVQSSGLLLNRSTGMSDILLLLKYLDLK